MHKVIAFIFIMFIGQYVLAQDQLSQKKIEKLYERGTELSKPFQLWRSTAGLF